MKFTIERSVVDNRITGYIADITNFDGKEIRINRYTSWSQCGVRYNEICYTVFMRDMMDESVRFFRLSDAKKFIAEMIGA
jgi:hypothetical protein